MDQRSRQPLRFHSHGRAFSRRPVILGLLFASSLISLNSLNHARGDTSIYGYEDRLHDRFYVGPDRAFIGEGYHWSGIGRIDDPSGTTGANWKTVTMISDNWFVTDQHHHPTHLDDPAGALSKVRFYRTNDPNGEYWESEIAMSGSEYQGTRAGLSDLWVGRLASTPPAWVTRYPLAKRQEAANYLSYTDNDLFIFGQDSPRSSTSVRVGRNEISEITMGGDYYFSFEPSTGFGRDEAQTEYGDSGSPSFFISGQVPVLAGTHNSINVDAGVSGNLSAIKAAVGEPISYSTGLLGDVNGDYRVNFLDVYAASVNLNLRQTARYYQGDITGDGNVTYADLALISAAKGKRLNAPSDFDRDNDVDGNDLAAIGNSWNQSVGAFTAGDADGNTLVNMDDVKLFDRNQRRVYFGPTPLPLSPVVGDCDGNGIVDGVDISEVNSHLNMVVSPGLSGDVDGNGKVETSDLIYVLLHSGDSFGDINGDHVVGPDDFSILASNWNRPVTGGRFQGDMDGNGLVNGQDAVVLFQWWSVGAGGFGPALAPEPNSIALVCVGSWLLWSAGNRRRRR